jgi:hypothetical protein
MSVQVHIPPVPVGHVGGLCDAGAGPVRDGDADLARGAAGAVGLGPRTRLLVEDWYRLRTMMLRQVRHAHQP